MSGTCTLLLNTGVTNTRIFLLYSESVQLNIIYSYYLDLLHWNIQIHEGVLPSMNLKLISKLFVADLRIPVRLFLLSVLGTGDLRGLHSTLSFSTIFLPTSPLSSLLTKESLYKPSRRDSLTKRREKHKGR